MVDPYIQRVQDLAAPLYYPGATTLGIRGVNNAVIAVEKGFVYGYFVMSKQTKKVFKITNYVGSACTGRVYKGPERVLFPTIALR